MKRRTSLSDIANALGLNKSTVSRALKHDKRISKATVTLVEEQAAKLGYRRDPSLATLSEIRWRKSDNRALMNWAFLVTELANRHIENQILLARMKSFSHDAGFSLNEIVLKPETSTRELIRILKARNIRGIIINQIYLKETVPLLDFDEIQSSAEACVYCGNFFFEPKGYRVIENYFATTMTALEKIQASGYRRIAVLYLERFQHSREIIRQRAAALLYHVEHPEIEISVHKVTEDNTIENYSGTDAFLLSHGVRLDEMPGKLIDLPLAILRIAPGADHLSGMLRPFDDLAASTVDLLDFQLRRRTLGTESKPHTILVEGNWQTGRTLVPQ